MSRNVFVLSIGITVIVTSREGRVSRNNIVFGWVSLPPSHVPRGACE